MENQNKVQQFIEFLKLEIPRQGLSIRKFAEKVGITEQAVHAWFSDSRTMNLRTYYKCLEVLNLKEQDLPFNK